MSASLAVVHGLLRHVLRLGVPLSLLLALYVYLYPLFLTCAFPLPTNDPTAPHSALPSFLETLRLHTTTTSSRSQPGLRVAPFRLLALGDPQLEGDTSIPNAYRDSSFPHLRDGLARLAARSDEYPTRRARLRQALHDLVDFVFDDVPDTLESVRKRVDLWGNDWYLAHQYRTLRWWALPTHVTVLGDLVGSQWISDDEFERRGRRYWDRVFGAAERVPDDVAAWPRHTYDVAGQLGLLLYDETWQARILNVAGNHDIGYAGDLTKERMARFERVYGKANYELRFELPPALLSPAAAATLTRNESSSPADQDSNDDDDDNDRLIPELRIVLVNNMNLDAPVLDTDLQDQTYDFINSVITTATAVEYKGHFTVVLAHVPLYKPAGVCVDAPYFTFHDGDGTLKEQNQLSADASRGFVEGIFGLSGDSAAPGRGQGRRGVILNGHDHEGCDTYHFINQTRARGNNGGNDDAEDGDDDDDNKTDWEAKRWDDAVRDGLVGDPSLPGVRELTVRSMMGDYGGNAGLLSAWFDEARWEWRYEFAQCALGTQHVWWAAHIAALVTVVAGCAYAAASAALFLQRRAQASSSLPDNKKDSGGGSSSSRKEDGEKEKQQQQTEQGQGQQQHSVVNGNGFASPEH